MTVNAKKDDLKLNKGHNSFLKEKSILWRLLILPSDFLSDSQKSLVPLVERFFAQNVSSEDILILSDFINRYKKEYKLHLFLSKGDDNIKDDYLSLRGVFKPSQKELFELRKVVTRVFQKFEKEEELRVLIRNIYDKDPCPCILPYVDNRHIKTSHQFHLVDPSPWPVMAAYGGLMITLGMVMYMHKFQNGFKLLCLGILQIIYVMFTWWRDVIREATFEKKHTKAVQRGLRLGFILFIISEVMFFFSFFWAFFYTSLTPMIQVGSTWPPKTTPELTPFGISLCNTCLLLLSGVSVTWAHTAVRTGAKRHGLEGLLYTILLAVLFMILQGYEYKHTNFSINSGVFGSCFFMLTGFHGFHVFAGTIALIVAMVRLGLNHFTTTQHVGLECAVWYWHFVDVVWVFLYGSLYWWGTWYNGFRKVLTYPVFF